MTTTLVRQTLLLSLVELVIESHVFHPIHQVIRVKRLGITIRQVEPPDCTKWTSAGQMLSVLAVVGKPSNYSYFSVVYDILRGQFIQGQLPPYDYEVILASLVEQFHSSHISRDIITTRSCFSLSTNTSAVTMNIQPTVAANRKIQGPKSPCVVQNYPKEPQAASTSLKFALATTKKVVRFDVKEDVVHYFPKVSRRDQEKVWSGAFQPQSAAEESRGLERQSLVGSARYVGNHRAALESVLFQQSIWQRRLKNCSSKTPMSMDILLTDMQESIATAYRQHTVFTRMAAARTGERDEQVARLNEYDATVSKLRSPTRKKRQNRSCRQKPRGFKQLLSHLNVKLQRVSG